MQNTVVHYIRNELNCYASHLVTYFRFGNNPSNGLVTERLQYSIRFCFFAKQQNQENMLILNRLRFILSVLLLIAFAGTFHSERDGFVHCGLRRRRIISITPVKANRSPG
jgi:hypothetical protein